MKLYKKISLIVLIIGIFLPNIVIAAGHDYVVEKNKRIPIPLTYKVEKVIGYMGKEAGFLDNPEDLFIDKKDQLYVVDTKNNRVIKMNLDGKVLSVFLGPQEKQLKEPKGIYVDEDGDMFIADTGNQRIIHLSPSGEFVEEFIKPDASILHSDFMFDPSKVYINTTGYIYAIKSQAFLSLDANNKFRGYVGATEVGFDFRRMLIRMFASEQQKDRLAKKLPASYSNFVMDDNGIIYATVINVRKGQIRKITSIGKNIYKDDPFGEIIIEEDQAKIPHFVDIALDDKGIISVIDENACKVYQYDQEGNLLTAFGNKGNQKGMFQIPSSLVVDKSGKIYVLDRKAGNIQIFKPTKFINMVHDAVALYNDGEYNKSRDIWRQVLEVDANYSLAHRGIAKALLKEEKWNEAMNEYKLAGDKKGYSDAFIQYRHHIYKTNFEIVIVCTLAVCVFLIKIISRLKKYAYSAIQKFNLWQGGVRDEYI